MPTITILKLKLVTKMNFRQALLTLAFIGIYFNVSWGQKRTVSNVVSIQLRNMGPILTKSEVTGYYMFYQTDRLSKNVYSYEIDILDQNLNKLTSHTIEGSKYLSLIDGIYNNSSLLLKLFDSNTEELTFTQYDGNAKEISKTVRVANGYEIMVISQTALNKEGQNITLFPIDKVGFVDYRSEKNKNYGYVIDFYPSEVGGKKWSVSSGKQSKVHEFASYIYGDENIIVSSIMSKSSLIGNSVEIRLLGVNAKTGEKMYDKALTDPNFEILILNGLESDSDGNVYMFGNYFPKGRSELSSPSLGLISVKLNNKGEVIEKNFISWADDVSKFIDINEKGKMKDVGFIFFHDVVRNADGNIYAIGEQYKKQMYGIGTDIVVEDLMIFELSKDYKLKKVNIVAKEKTKFSLPDGMGMNSSQILSYFVKSLGGFDYEFIEFNKDHSIFSIGYIDYVKLKGEDNKFIFGSITYTDSKPTKDSVELKTVKEKKSIRVLPAKIGNIVIVEYSPKEKTLNMRIEKLNY